MSDKKPDLLRQVAFALVIGACSSASDEVASPAGGTSSDAGTDASIADASGSGDSESVDAGETADAADATSSFVHVMGTAYHLAFDDRIAGGTVLIESSSGTVSVKTAADGTFDVPNVHVPYDLTLTSTEKGVDAFDRYVGLTTATPTIESGRSTSVTPNTATITGTVTGIADPIPAGTILRVFARTTGGGIANSARYEGMSPAYTITPEWFGATTKNITVHAIAYAQTGNAHPTAFSGYGELSASVTSGQPTSNANVAMTTPTTTTVSGTFTPADFSGTVGAQFFANGSRETAWEGMGFGAPATSPFSFAFPVVPNASFGTYYNGTLDGGATVADIRRGALGAGNDFVVPTPAVLLTPADKATYTSSFQFSWSGPANAVYRLAVRQKSGPVDDSFFLITKATSATLPLGFGVASKSTYVWDVAVLQGVTDVDMCAGPNGQTVFGSISTSRTFNTP